MNRCDSCRWFRIKSDDYGVCDNLKNDTKVMSINLIMHLTSCNKEIAEHINHYLMFNRSFGCIYHEEIK